MKLTIIPSDGAVYKDGVSYSGLSIVDAPNNIHALQWSGEKGWIEFIADENSSKLSNEPIVSLPDWAMSALSKWDEAKAVEEAARAAAEALETQTELNPPQP